MPERNAAEEVGPEDIVVVMGCGCEAKWWPVGILALWKSIKVCETHRPREVAGV